MKKKKHPKQAGFSLIEMLVVLAIIGLIIGLMANSLKGGLNKGQETKVKADLHTLKGALTIYQLNNGVYPSTAEGLTKLAPKYIEKIPKDPWHNGYLYIKPGKEGRDYDLYTEGADGVAGGDGLNARIGQWNL